MADGFIVRRGGAGGGIAWDSAIIHVYAPAGSTVTAQKSGGTAVTLQEHTVSGADSEYIHIVKIADYGTYTITATKSGETATETAVVNDNVEYPIRLSYNFYIIKNGAYQIPLTNVQGFTISISSVLLSGAAEAAFRTANKYDFSSSTYKYITVRFSAATSPHNYPLNLVVTDQTGSYENFINVNPNNPPSGTILYAKKQPITQSAVNELTLSLGTLTGSHYIGIGAGYIQNSSVLDLYLSR